MKRALVRTTLGIAAVAVTTVEAIAHPAGGTTDLTFGLDHVLADPLHLLSIAGILASVAAVGYVGWRLLQRSSKAADKR